MELCIIETVVSDRVDFPHRQYCERRGRCKDVNSAVSNYGHYFGRSDVRQEVEENKIRERSSKKISIEMDSVSEGLCYPSLILKI